MVTNITKFIIGSRDSRLALIQAQLIEAELKKLYPELEIEIKKIKTQGDKILDTALSKIGDKGLFVKELEKELLDESIDLAVHSMKDLPTILPEGLEIAATSTREDVRDVVCISPKALSEGIIDISKAKIIGTSSPRRIAQLKRKYPHIKFVDIRGNLNTRFRKLDAGSISTVDAKQQRLDGIILAAAGIKRLGAEDRITQYLDPLEILPAIGQGALAIEIKSSRADIKKIVSKLNSPVDEVIIKGERAFLRALEGGCQKPIGIYAQLCGTDTITYTGMIADENGNNYLRASIEGNLCDAESLGTKLAAEVLPQNP
jgi:hydroxymethylbilane synthase